MKLIYMDLSQKQKDKVIQSIIANAKLDFSYLLINGIATIVACSGLLTNSTAVVIGSMLIATLLSPIAGIALGLADKNPKNIFQSIQSLFSGILLVIIIAFLFGLFFPNIQATDKMLARTEPGLFDFIIAFFGGLAGAISLLFKRYNGIMIGVGIATALVPPLSTAGIFLSKENYDLAIKAFLLASINIVFIMLAYYLVFKYFKLSTKQQIIEPINHQ